MKTFSTSFNGIPFSCLIPYFSVNTDRYNKLLLTLFKITNNIFFDDDGDDDCHQFDTSEYLILLQIYLCETHQGILFDV